ncbi:MAG: hypothetical protein ABIK28_10990 [Planctomycetota bacterium]
MSIAQRMKCYLYPPIALFIVVLSGFVGSNAGAQVLGTGAEVPGMIHSEATITFEAKERPISDVLDHIRNIVGVNILLDPGIEEMISLKLNDVPWRDALEIVAEKAGCIVVEKSTKIFKVEKPPRVTFSFYDEDIKLVINAIAQSAGADVIIAPEVVGKVNMTVDDIPWKDALDNVIKTLGYHMVEEDRGVLRVVTAASLTQQLETRIYELRYIRPRNTYMPKLDSEYVEGEIKAAQGDSRKDFPLLQALESMLSDNGKLDYFPRENVVFVKDIKPVLDKIGDMIDRLDQEPLQIEVNVQFMTYEKTDTFDASFGVAGQNGNGLAASLNGASKVIAFPFNLGKGSWADNVLPGAAGDANVTPGKLDFSLTQFLVKLIQVNSYTRISQAPRLVTLDHHESTINVGDSVRWAQIEASSSQSGTLEYTIKEAEGSPVHVGFQLYITPHIIAGTNKIILDVIPKSDTLNGKDTDMVGFDKFSIGEGGENQIFLPRVRSQTIVTNLMLESGQTGVLGGLVTNRENEVLTKVPWLGDIPILGYLFKSKSTSTVREELLVMITPTIIKGAAQAQEKLEGVVEKLEEMHNEEYDGIFGTAEEEE